MKISTIGTSKKSLEKFITLLKESKVDLVVDIRLHSTSQLAGFSKKDDLAYLLNLVGINYVHEPMLAPTDEIFKAYRSKDINADEFTKVYQELLVRRNAFSIISSFVAKQHVCFLCSEDRPVNCHRRVLVDYYANLSKEEVQINHLQ